MKNFIKKAFKFIKNNLTILIIAFIFLFLYLCDNSSSVFGSYIINNLKSIATSFTPTTDLFDDGSEVSFVSYFFGMKTSKNSQANIKDINFSFPVINADNLSQSDFNLVFNNSGIVYNMADGKVCNIGYNDENLKYIEILHDNGYKSVFVGLNNVGVSLGEYLYQNCAIGLSDINLILNVSIFDENNNQINLKTLTWI